MSWHEWFFSGIGTTGIVLVGGQILRSRKAKKMPGFRPVEDDHSITDDHSVKQEQPTVISGDVVSSAIIAAPVSKSQIAVGNNIDQSHHIHHHAAPSEQIICTEPRPEEILHSISSALPFDRDHVQAKYIGLEVTWELAFTSVSPFRGEKQMVHFRDDDWMSISFIASSVPQELRIAPSESLVTIRGKIRSLNAAGLTLDDDPEILRVRRPKI